MSALTGPVLVDPTSADLSIEGHVSARPDGMFEAHVRATARDGSQRGARTLTQAGDCRALDEALALVIALLVDPDLALERLPPSMVALGAEGTPADQLLLRELDTLASAVDAPTDPAAPSQATAPAPAIAPKAHSSGPSPAPSVSTPSDARQGASRVSLHAGAALGVRELPRTALGAYTSVALRARSWLALELQGRALFALGEANVEGDARISALSFDGSALVCPRSPDLRAVFLEGCTGFAAGFIRAHGAGFSQGQTGFVATGAALVGAGIGVHVRGAWALRLRGTLRVLLHTPRFVYEDGTASEVAFAPQRAAGGLTLGVERKF